MAVKGKFGIADVIIYAFLFVYAILIILPIWNILVISLSTSEQFRNDPYHLWLTDINFNEYKRAFSNMGGIIKSFLVSVRVTAYGTLLSLVLTSLGAYALTKESLPGQKIIFRAIIFTMFFDGGLMPFYMVVRNLKLIDTIFAMFLPTAISTFNLIVMKSFFESIPPALEESAKIDGCNDIYILWKIVLPISVPAIAAIGLFYGVGYWNAYFYPSLFINTNSLLPLPVVIRQMVIQNLAAAQVGARIRDSNYEQFKMACIVIAIVPVVLVYPFIQKYFTKGIMLGAVKG